jgi:ADP-ribose pyrophosphatase
MPPSLRAPSHLG